MWLHRKKGSVKSEESLDFTRLVNFWTATTGTDASMINTSTFKITNSNATGATLTLNSQLQRVTML